MADAPAARSPAMTRDEWVAKYSRMKVSTIVVSEPLPERYSIDSGLTLLRVGSFWKEDVEQHVYSIEQAVSVMTEMRERASNMIVVTPVFVFRRCGDKAEPVTNETILRKASASFIRLFGESFRRMHRG